ncbi:MAG: tetratricopeptide repeat protein [Thermodesulfobacteriota bacterium]
MKNRIILSILLIAVLTFISFSISLDNGFTNWDDQEFVADNPLIKDISWENTKVIFTSFYKKAYSQPLVLLSFSLEYHFFQLDPFIYHLDNLILHILNSLLVFYIIFILSEKISLSLVTALLFGVHPLHVESVAWVSERKDMLSTLFFLSALLSYLFYRKKDINRYYYLSVFVFILALFSKPMAVTLPLVLVLCDYLSYRSFDRAAILEKIPYLILSGIFGVITIIIHQTDTLLVSMPVVSFIERFFIACRNLIFYLTKIIVPLNLSAIYPYPEGTGILLPAYFLILFLMLLTVLYTRRWTRDILFGAIFFIITVLPVLRLIPFPGGGAITADRYMYIPSLGLFYIAGSVFYRVYNGKAFGKLSKVLSVILLSGVILIFSVLTYQRNNIWQDGETLWLNVIENYPDVPIVHNNLGTVYAEQGRLDDAVREYQITLRLDPNYVKAHYNLGVTYAKQGKLNDAIKEYQVTLDVEPEEYAETHNDIGSLYAEQGRLDDAIREYKTTLKLRPDFAEAHYNLGIAYAKQGRLDEAIQEYNRALKSKPEYVNAHYNLGIAYYNKRAWDSAISSYKDALRITPYDADIMNNLGNIYIRKGQLDKAIITFKKALKVDPDSSITHYNLGVIYRKKGMQNQARLEFQEALKINPDFNEAYRNLRDITNR